MRARARARALKYNALTSLLSEVVVFVCGLILPRMILSIYGSASNGLVSSISQFLGFSVVLRAGVGAVTRAALFKPLADHDVEQINRIMAATRTYMQKIALIIGGGVFLFSIIYPFMVIDEYDWLYSFAMVLVLGITVFADNFFGIKNMILLQADQKYYIQTLASILSQILSCVVSIILMQMHLDMLIVKLGSVVALLSRPAFLEFYVKKNYHLDLSVKPDNLALQQRWDAFAQQLAIIINGNIPVVLITLFAPLSSVSVYTVHFMVVNNMGKIVQAPLTGLSSTFGNMLATGENENIKKVFNFIQWGVFSAGILLFGITAVMLTPFVDVYTRSVTDVDYHQPLFGMLMVIAVLFNCLRMPYQMLVEAAGHFKQTRNGAILEVVLNIIISVLLVWKMGIMGVVIGTIIACIVRTLQYSVYSMKHILHLSVWNAAKSYLIYLGAGALGVFVCQHFFDINATDYLNWALQAIPVSIIFVVIIGLFSLLFNRQEILYLWKRIKSSHKKKTKTPR